MGSRLYNSTIWPAIYRPQTRLCLPVHGVAAIMIYSRWFNWFQCLRLEVFWPCFRWPATTFNHFRSDLSLIIDLKVLVGRRSRKMSIYENLYSCTTRRAAAPCRHWILVITAHPGLQHALEDEMKCPWSLAWLRSASYRRILPCACITIGLH